MAEGKGGTPCRYTVWLRRRGGRAAELAHYVPRDSALGVVRDVHSLAVVRCIQAVIGRNLPACQPATRERQSPLAIGASTAVCRPAGGRGRGGRALSPLFSDIRRHRWFGTELQLERRADLEVTQQEAPLVEPPSAQPAGDLVVALARVARAAGRHDVVERVTAPAGDCQYAVALQRTVARCAIRAPTPRDLERHPLGGAEVVVHTLHPALASAGSSNTATSVDSHAASVGGRAPRPRTSARASSPDLVSVGAGDRGFGRSALSRVDPGRVGRLLSVDLLAPSGLRDWSDER